MRESLRYSIFDPTGNITALVESPVPVGEQPAVAAALMRRHPAVEQTGFVHFAAEEPAEIALRMAGGEFCGNASMSAAALSLLRTGRTEGRVSLRVSGAEAPVEVRLEQGADGSFGAGVRMPPVREISEFEPAFGGRRETLPLVRLEGIAHLILRPESGFFALLHDREAAGRAARLWCAELGAEGLGLMFLEGDRLTPLVYVPGSGTVFWENSCASGSAAAGAFLAAVNGAPEDLTLREPGGCLRVRSEPGGETWLCGRARLLGEYEEKGL